MNGVHRYRVLAVRYLRVALLLPLTVLETHAAELTATAQGVQQRLALAGHLINKMSGHERTAFMGELRALQARSAEQVDGLLQGDVDAFFQSVIARYRALAPTTGAVDSIAEQKRYRAKLSEVSAFRESYEDFVGNRGEEARAVLDEEKFSKRIDRAARLADKGAYSEAYSLVDGANHQLIAALQVLRDKQTVEYRLDFASPSEEYAYEDRRFRSQKMLLDMVVAEKKPPQNSMQLINALVEVADGYMREAKGLAESGSVELAIERQEQAVEELTKAMRIAGVYF